MISRIVPLATVLFLLLPAFAPLPAQEGGSPSKPTVITSDKFTIDTSQKEGRFSGNVVVTGADLKITCRDLKIFFKEDNSIDRLLAEGDVVINQPNRITKSGRAEYFGSERKIILTDAPEVNDNGKIVSAKEITYWLDSERMETGGGGASRVIIPVGQGIDKPSK
jgi:lipopolysaccharide transport protein LptA